MLTLATEMVSQGHCVTLFSLKNTAQYEVPNRISLVFPLASFGGKVRGWFNRKKLAALLQASVDEQQAKHGAFDLILVNLHESYRLASACHFSNVRYVIHNSYVQELKREKLMGPIKYFYMKRILTLLNGKDLIAVSKEVADELSRASLFKARSIRHIYNPLDFDAIRKLSEDSLSVASPSVECDDIPDAYILHVGRAAKAKRHDVLFEAFNKVNPKYKLVCLSANTKKLKRLAQKYGIADRVVLPGFTSNPYAWMKRAELLVLSSDFEGLGMVLIEALACSTKVVSTDCDFGPREIMQGELSEYLVPVRAPDALAKAINRAIDAKLDLSDLALEQNFDKAEVTQQYLELAG